MPFDVAEASTAIGGERLRGDEGKSRSRKGPAFQASKGLIMLVYSSHDTAKCCPHRGRMCPFWARFFGGSPPDFDEARHPSSHRSRTLIGWLSFFSLFGLFPEQPPFG